MPLVGGQLIKGNICVLFEAICCIRPILIWLVAENPCIPYILYVFLIAKELFEVVLLTIGL